MRNLHIAIAAASTLAGCAPTAVPRIRPDLSELAGLTPGAPQRCVPIQSTEALRLEAERTVLYGRGGYIWLNRLGAGCAGLRRGDVLIVTPIGDRYCRGDPLRSRDPVSGEPGPGCTLSEFIPYRR